MIIVINSQGKVVSQQNDNLFQGSVNANVINLVAPFSNNIDFYATFELPDGRILPETKQYGYKMESSIKIIDGLNVWKFPVNFPISQLYGTVTIQFKGIVGNQIVCTSSVKVTIQKGVPYNTNEEDLEPTQFEILSAMIQDIKALLNNKVEIENAKYDVAEVNEDTVGIYWIFNEETNQYVSVALPEKYNEDNIYYKQTNIGRVVNNNDGVYFEYIENDVKTKIDVKSDKVLINNEKIVVEAELKANNIEYDNKYSELKAKDVQNALDELKFALSEVETTQVIELGEQTFVQNGWVENNGIYQYKFYNEDLKDALVQSLIITPNKETIDNLNVNNIFVYPEVEMVQENETIAYGIIKADKKPEFDFVANVKLQGTSINVNTQGIKASQIIFTPTKTILSDRVQTAIEEVQTNLNDFENQYNTDKTSFVKLDDNGKIPAIQLPSYVDDVVEAFLHNGAMWQTKIEDEYEDLYDNAITPVSGKIYVDLNTEKTYRWGGSQYVVISDSLAIGETTGTAYDGGKGKQNADNISNLTQTVNEEVESINNEIQQLKERITLTKDENGVLKIGEFIIPQEKLLWSGTKIADSIENVSIDLTSSNLPKGSIIKIEVKIYNENATNPVYIEMKCDDNLSSLNAAFNVVGFGGRIVSNDSTDYIYCPAVAGIHTVMQNDIITELKFTGTLFKNADNTSEWKQTKITRIWQVIK